MVYSSEYLKNYGNLSQFKNFLLELDFIWNVLGELCFSYMFCNFPGITNMSAFLEYCQDHISIYRYSSIHKDQTKKLDKLWEKSVA